MAPELTMLGMYIYLYDLKMILDLIERILGSQYFYNCWW